MYKEIIRESSTNGRWGLVIVSNTKEDLDLHQPTEGRLISLGIEEGRDIFEFVPEKTGQWIMVGGDLTAVCGCNVFYTRSLQSNRGVSIAVGGDFFAVKSYGYKGRSSGVWAFKKGEVVDLPTPVLMAMGLLPVKKEVIEIEIPPIGGDLKAALEAAGL